MCAAISRAGASRRSICWSRRATTGSRPGTCSTSELAPGKPFPVWRVLRLAQRRRHDARRGPACRSQAHLARAAPRHSHTEDPCFDRRLLYLSNQPRVFKFVRDNGLAKQFARALRRRRNARRGARRRPRAQRAKDHAPRSTCSARACTNEREARAAAPRVPRASSTASTSRSSTRTSRSSSRRWASTSPRSSASRSCTTSSSARATTTPSCGSTWRGARTPSARCACSRTGSTRLTARTSASCCRAISIARSADVERAIQLKCRVRICKGAYKEPAPSRFPTRRTSTRTTCAACRR